jgi:8-oxo-dGTP pyrophosphatase MutT (NUDIX family)
MMLGEATKEVVEPRPASTVVLLRDTPEGMETLLLRRNKALLFAGGFWVFPGGSLDPQDLAEAGGDEQRASRIAAAREAFEESGLRPHLEDMVQLSHWTTPEAEPRRFSTWIYAAPLAADEEVVIDGGEIHDHRWITVRDALAEHAAGELGILPPTFITLAKLASYASVAEMVAEERSSPCPEVLPVIGKLDGEFVAMYRGDAGYESGDCAAPGPRHRAVLHGRCWHYVYRDVAPEFPPLLSDTH